MEVGVIRYTKRKLADCLKIINWVLNQPNLTNEDSVCEWYTKEGKVYLAVSTQDLFLELYIQDSDQEFHIAVPPKPFQQLIAKMDNEIEVTLQETTVVLQDSIQRVQLSQTPKKDLPVFASTGEWYAMPHARPIIKHLHGVATEQTDVSDLDLAFTTNHAFIGNYAYAKRIPYVTEHGFTLTNVLTKLILAVLHEQGTDDLSYGFFRNYSEMLGLKLGEHKLYTNLYSKVVPAVDSLFASVQANHVVEVPLNALQDVLVRLKAISTDASVQLEFTEDFMMKCSVANTYQTSEFTQTYSGTAFDLMVDVDINALYHLLKTVVAAETVQLRFDVEQEVLCIVNEDNEMLVSLLVG